MAHILQVRNLSKSFPGARALDEVSLDIARGEVHVLAGENGAGKSTLVKILAGLEPAGSGEILFDGRAIRPRSPHDALRAGISMIHQELMPFLNLTVAANICMGREPVNRLGWLDKPAMNREARELLEPLGVAIDPARRMRELTIAGMQTVEIAKALGYRSKLLIMDEPTSAISDREVEALLRLILDLKERGVTIVYISHRMKEIFRIADTVTVLRDGRHVATLPISEVDENGLISLMVGRELTSGLPQSTSPKGQIALEAVGLGRAGRFRDVSFHVRAGEVLGIAGLMGAGRSELVSALFGLEPADTGEIRVQGRRVRIGAPSVAMANGIALVTEDRKASGLVPDMSVAHNLTLASLRRLCHGPFIAQTRERTVADEEIRRFSIRTAGRDQKIKHLSGGNQQKVVIAKALLTGPSVLILDEPTRGIDIGAKAEVYAIIARLARQGKAIVMVSSELSEVMSLSDRILVMREGTVSAELSSRETTSEEVLRYAMPQ